MVVFMCTKSIHICLKTKKKLKITRAKANKIEEKFWNNKQYFHRLPVVNSQFTFTVSVCKEVKQ